MLKAGTYQLQMSPRGKLKDKIPGAMPFAVLSYGSKLKTTITRF